MTSLPLLAVPVLVAAMTTQNPPISQPADQAPPASPAVTVVTPATEEPPQLFESRKKAALDLLHARMRQKAPLPATPEVTEVAPHVLAPGRVVCGIRVIVGDATIDPKILRFTPDDAGDFKIKRIDSPACKE